MSRVERMVLDIRGPRDLRSLDRLPASLRFTAMVLSGFKYGRLDMVLPDARTLRFTGKEAGPEAEMIVHDQTFARTVAARGDIGFAEVFMDGKFDSPDLATLLEYFSINWDDLGTLGIGNAIAQFIANVRHMLRSNTKKGSKRNILAHYDLGNDFYSAWLDPTMTYSSAIFSSPDQTMMDGQLAK